MPAWHPGDAWPSSTPGGAISPHWGGYVKLWVRAALAAGETFHMGKHANDRLDAGNVMGGAPEALVRAPRVGTVERLWIDLSCDVLDVQIAGGASSSQGIFSKPDTATMQVTLSDPGGIYDPLSNVPPWSYGGRSRLVPGTPVECFAEIVNGDTGALSRVWLFTGGADSWGEDWTPTPSRRTARLVASDETKQWARYNLPEGAAVGADDTISQRVARLVAAYQWAGIVQNDPDGGTVTLAATTLAQTGWELLNRTLDDELGYVYFTPTGALRWVNRGTWYEHPAPILALGCPDLEEAGETFRDVIIDASPSTIDDQVRNSIYAARTGGTTVTAISQSSIERYGFRYDYKRTDLGLANDAQVGAWAQVVLELYAYPQISLADITMRPAIDARSWEVFASVLGVQYVSDLVRVVWAPPDLPTHEIDVLSRVVGAAHKITRAAFETRWQLVGSGGLASSGAVFTMGPDANDRLDAGYIMGRA